MVAQGIISALWEAEVRGSQVSVSSTEKKCLKITVVYSFFFLILPSTSKNFLVDSISLELGVVENSRKWLLSHQNTDGADGKELCPGR